MKQTNEQRNAKRRERYARRAMVEYTNELAMRAERGWLTAFDVQRYARAYERLAKAQYATGEHRMTYIRPLTIDVTINWPDGSKS